MTHTEQKIVDVLMDDMLGEIACKYSDFTDACVSNSSNGKVPGLATMLAVTDYYQNLIDGNVS
jgi:hypothetical protein